jgi:hypothetical protein
VLGGGEAKTPLLNIWPCRVGCQRHEQCLLLLYQWKCAFAPAGPYGYFFRPSLSRPVRLSCASANHLGLGQRAQSTRNSPEKAALDRTGLCVTNRCTAPLGKSLILMLFVSFTPEACTEWLRLRLR